MKNISACLRGALPFFTVLLLSVLLLFFPAAAAGGAKRGVGYCLNILIPSLFPFMVLSAYLVNSGMSDKIGRVLEGFTQKVFRLPGCCAAIILMSMIGGYPVGARGIAALRKRGGITPLQAERMLCFCVNSGPAFVISVVGAALLKSPSVGVLLLAAQLLASLILSFLSLFTFPKEDASVPRKTRAPAGPALLESVSDAARGMCAMCAFVVLFAALISLLREIGADQWLCGALLQLGIPESIAASLLSVLLEVTGGCSDAAASGAGAVFLSFAVGWGGLCVHFQILASVPGMKVSRLRFTLFRLLHGLIASSLSALLLALFPQAAPVFSSTSAPLSGALSGSAPAAVSLILLCASLLCTIGLGKVDSTQRM